jgi:hypothetical protein
MIVAHISFRRAVASYGLGGGLGPARRSRLGGFGADAFQFRAIRVFQAASPM